MNLLPLLMFVQSRPAVVRKLLHHLVNLSPSGWLALNVLEK